MAAPLGPKPDNVDDKDWKAMQNELAKISRSAMTPQMLANARPDQLGNDAGIEEAWAVKAGEWAEHYWSLVLKAKDKKNIKLTKIDDEIYRHFREVFPHMKISYISEASITAEREKWQNFCMQYKNSEVKNFNMGTLLRPDATKEFSQDNAIIVPRIQFHAIELARNREGVNDLWKPTDAAAAAPAAAAEAAEKKAT